MELVECITLGGDKKLISKDDLVLRPAVYGIIIHEGKVLLMQMRYTGKYHPPGGGIHLGERIKDALRRELREETGLEVEIGGLARFAEIFFYYDPSQTAYHGLHFYYRCRPKSLTLLADEQVDDDAAGRPRWVKLSSLHPEDFQAHGELILDICYDRSL